MRAFWKVANSLDVRLVNRAVKIRSIARLKQIVVLYFQRFTNTEVIRSYAATTTVRNFATIAE